MRPIALHCLPPTEVLQPVFRFTILLGQVGSCCLFVKGCSVNPKNHKIWQARTSLSFDSRTPFLRPKICPMGGKKYQACRANSANRLQNMFIYLSKYSHRNKNTQQHMSGLNFNAQSQNPVKSSYIPKSFLSPSLSG